MAGGNEFGGGTLGIVPKFEWKKLETVRIAGVEGLNLSYICCLSILPFDLNSFLWGLHLCIFSAWCTAQNIEGAQEMFLKGNKYGNRGSGISSFYK